MNLIKQMKSRLGNLRYTLALCAVALASPILEAPCHAQVYPTYYGNFSGVSSVMPSVANSNLTSTIELRKDRGIALLASAVATNSAVSNVVFTFQVSADGTNYSTTADGVFQINVPLNGTTTSTGYTNVPPSFLNNVRYLRLSSLSNYHNATVTINRLQYSFSQ